MVEFALSVYKDVVLFAVPVAIVFEIGNLIVGTFLRTAFGGRLWFGR